MTVKGTQARMATAVGLLVAAALLAPSTASAERFEMLVLKPDATKNHKVKVYGTERAVSFDVKKGKRLTAYGAPGRTDEREMRGDLGSFGRVAVRFNPSGETREVPLPKGCRGKPGKRILGTARGTIRFRGERGYTTVDQKRAPAYREISARIESCRGEEGGGRFVSLYAYNRRTDVDYSAFVRKSGGKVRHAASVSDREGKVMIFRNAFVRGPKFRYASDYSTAFVDPPSPFRGVARFRASEVGGDPGVFKGKLRVSFLGTGKVRLAGAGYKAFLSEISPVRAVARGARSLTRRGASGPAAAPAAP